MGSSLRVANMWRLFTLFTVITLLFIDQTTAVTSVHYTPAVHRYRKELAAKNAAKKAREVVRPVPPKAPRSANGFTPWEPKFTSAFSSAHKNRHRQKRQQDVSCNNVTITPPGFDGSCSAAHPCPNGACWYVPLL
jgi:hypothetical protein